MWVLVGTPASRANSTSQSRIHDESMIAIFRRVVAEKVMVTIDGKSRTMTRGALVLYANRMKALQRDQKARNNMLKFAEATNQLDDREAEEQQSGFLLVPEPMTREEFDVAVAKLNAEGEEKYRREQILNNEQRLKKT